MRGSIEVHRYLTEREIPHEFYRLGRPLRNLAEAPELLDLAPEAVVAVALFEARPSYVLALTPAGVETIPGAVARAAGGDRRVRAASPARVTRHTGFMRDWLPPVGHDRPSRAILDRSLADAEVLYAPGGDPGVMLVIRADDLVRATSAQIRPLTIAETLV